MQPFIPSRPEGGWHIRMRKPSVTRRNGTYKHNSHLKSHCNHMFGCVFAERGYFFYTYVFGCVCVDSGMANQKSILHSLCSACGFECVHTCVEWNLSHNLRDRKTHTHTPKSMSITNFGITKRMCPSCERVCWSRCRVSHRYRLQSEQTSEEKTEKKQDFGTARSFYALCLRACSVFLSLGAFSVTMSCCATFLKRSVCQSCAQERVHGNARLVESGSGNGVWELSSGIYRDH